MEEVRKQGVESLFCPYEQALELKELGFDEPCFAFYGLSRDDYKTIRLSIFQNLKTDYLSDLHHLDVTCDAQTFSQAFRFFREKYNIRGFITQKVAGDFGFEIYVPNKENPIGKPFNRIGEFTKHFKTFEEAQIACLKKLIEIAKEQNVK